MQPAVAVNEQSVFEAAANQESYRVADVELARCKTHGAAAVLCFTAGKVGRNGRSAAVGATLFWLTCPYMNTMLARLERHGAVAALQKLLDEKEIVSAEHVASHACYEERARALLSTERWTFFDSHFVSIPESSGGRKYGNAAVGHAKDLKCLHALVAQSLCGAPNPIGDALLHYILFLSNKVKNSAETVRDSDFEEGENETKKKKNNNNNNNNNNILESMKRSFDDVSILVGFVESWVAKAKEGTGMFPVALNANDFCSAACRVLTFLEGKPPKTRKKRRIN